MPIVIQPYLPQHEAAVNDFNRRVLAGNTDPSLVFFRRATPEWLPRTEDCTAYQEYFVAVDNGVVRGAYALKRQNFSFADGSVRQVGYYHHPLSEGIVDKSYAMVGALLLRDAMQRSPLLYCLGMGGYDRPLPQMLMKMGWSHCAVPFYFKVVHPYKFLRQMQALRTSALRRSLLDSAAFTGSGWMAAKMLDAVKKMQSPASKNYSTEQIEQFSDWADSLWQQSKNVCTLTAVRDAAVLRDLYPPDETNLTRLRIKQDGIDAGWVVVGERRKDAKYGSMRVGSIVDCWAAPEHALAVIRAAMQALERKGMDLIVSNQSHQSWGRAFESAGFFQTESSFIFAASKKLAEFLQPFPETKLKMHFTRADGDGLPANF